MVTIDRKVVVECKTEPCRLAKIFTVIANYDDEPRSVSDRELAEAIFEVEPEATLADIVLAMNEFAIAARIAGGPVRTHHAPRA
jgi:hypothetical protein